MGAFGARRIGRGDGTEVWGAGGWKLDAGSGKLEAGGPSPKPEPEPEPEPEPKATSWRLDAGSWKLEVGRWKLGWIRGDASLEDIRKSVRL